MEKWHSLDVVRVSEWLNVDPEKGLTHQEAKKRLSIFGYNELPTKKKKSLIKIILEQFKDIFVMLLLFAVIVAAIAGESIVDVLVIIAIIMINVIISVYQEYKAENILEKLKEYTAPKAKVIREGKIVEINSRELVPGDVIVIGEGDKVPADARVIESSSLKVDESALTGESVPITKITDALPEDTEVPEQKNIVFMGTYVVSGHGKAIVVRTGTKTEFGRIAKLVEEVEEETTPLKEKMNQFARQIAIAVAILTVVLLYIEYVKLGAAKFIDSLIVAISLAVAAVPEGLPAVLTIALALAVAKLRKNNALVKYLLAAETLGSVTVICSDKTGTITKGEMTVNKVYVDGKMYEVTGVGYSKEGEFILNNRKVDPKEDPILIKTLTAGLLCSNVSFDGKNFMGDPTEISIVVAALKAGLKKEELEKKYPRVEEISFSSIRKRMTTIHKTSEGYIAFIKGAPELLLERSIEIETSKGRIPLDPEKEKEILSIIDSLASEGYRVLGIAYKQIDNPHEDPDIIEDKLVFLGLVAIIDPPRPEVYEAVKKALRAGIEVKMITGDHALTAKAIAEDIGLYKPGDLVLTGKDLNKLSDKELEEIIDKVKVFARVMPEHKLRIVRALKKKGHIVAMTGDGVNDAPALKEAHIGIAMGIKGTDVAKEASDMILLDDNFATIVRAVEIGRGVYNRIRSFSRYLVSCNLAEVMIITLGIILFPELPLLPAMILWINLVTDGPPATALAWDPDFEDVMSRPPRSPKEGLFSGLVLFTLVASLVLTIGVIGTYYYYHDILGITDFARIRTIIFLQIALFELFIIWNSRSEKYSVFRIGFKGNKWLVISVLLSIIATLGLVYSPLAYAFHLVPIGLEDWLFVLPVAITGLFIVPEIFIRETNRASR